LVHAFTVPSGEVARGGVHVGGYSILQADSADALRPILASHPHLLIPGSAIEVHELLAMPGS
jgi:hypothetical protein